MKTTIKAEEEKIYLTLNLEDPKLKGQWQMIHIENTDQTTFGIVTMCGCKALKGKYKINEIRFKVLNYCGENFGIGNLISDDLLNKYTLMLYPLDATHPVEMKFPVNILLSQGEKFNLNVETMTQPTRNLKIGVRVCQIEVA